MRLPATFGVSRSMKIRTKVRVSQACRCFWMIFRILRRYFKYLKLAILHQRRRRPARKVVATTSSKWTKVKSNYWTRENLPEIQMEQVSYQKWALRSNQSKIASWCWRYTSWNLCLMKTMQSLSRCRPFRGVSSQRVCGLLRTAIEARAVRAIHFLIGNYKLWISIDLVLEIPTHRKAKEGWLDSMRTVTMPRHHLGDQGAQTAKRSSAAFRGSIWTRSLWDSTMTITTTDMEALRTQKTLIQILYDTAKETLAHLNES